MGWGPSRTSMLLRRRWAREAKGSRWWPEPSGPRWRMVSVMRATSESGDAPGVRVTNPAMPHISDAVEATFLNSHTRRLVRRWPREDENGGGWRSSSSRSFLPNKANDVKPFIFMVPTTYRPLHFRSLAPGGIFGRSRWLFHWSICDLVTIALLNRQKRGLDRRGLSARQTLPNIRDWPAGRRPRIGTRF